MSLTIAFFMTSGRGVTATPGYFIADTPWAGVVNDAVISRFQASSALGGGIAGNNGVQGGNKPKTNHWVDSGTYKLVVIYQKSSDYGIATYYLNSTSVGTVDQYASSLLRNNYAEITGLARTALLTSLEWNAPSKNASSTGYYLYDNTHALVRTGA